MSTIMREVWLKLVECLERGIPCALATVVRTAGSVPREPGAKMLVLGDGSTVGTVGGGALEHAVIEAAREVLLAGAPRLLSYQLKPDLGMACGGSAEVFVEPLQRVDNLYLFGAGHIGKALCPIAAVLGFRVTVIDERRELANAERMPQAAAFVHGFDASVWQGVLLDGGYCVVVSPSHAIDTGLVTVLLGRPGLRYVGMIGSKSKRRSVEQALAAAGLPSDALTRLHTPVGISIGAETPEEIAVSIAAELVRVRRGAEQ
jgi:xanthine dehydrogenase accessory factor